MSDFNSKQSLLDKVIHTVQAAGADHVSASIESSRSTAIRFAENRSTQQMQHCNEELTLAVAIDQREAVLRSNRLDKQHIEAMSKKVVEMAKLAPMNKEFSEPVPPGGTYIETSAYFDSIKNLSLESCAKSVRKMCDQCEGQAIDLYGNLTINSYQLSVANSCGLFIEQPASDAKISVTARTRQDSGSSQFHISEGDWNEINFDTITKQVAQVAIESKNPTRLDPGRYTVILSPKAVSEYLMFLFWAMDERMADQGQSFFSCKENGTKLGQKLFADTVTISSLVNHPRLPHLKFGQAFGSGGSDAGMMFSLGLPVKSVDWIKNGEVKTLRNSPFYARQKGRQPVGYPFNLAMNGENVSKDDLVKSVDRGLLIESFWYVNPTDWNSIALTGLTRDGVFLIENGEISRSVNNFRFNDSPVESLKNISGLSNPEKTHGEYWPALMPWMKIDSFNLSAVSNAV